MLFKAGLVDPRISEGARRIEVERSVLGTAPYLVCAPLGLVAPVVAELLFVAIPIAFIVPGLFGRIGNELRAFGKSPAAVVGSDD